MPGPPNEDEMPWFDSEKEAYIWIDKRGCRFEKEGIACEMCAAEWAVFNEEEIAEIQEESTEQDIQEA